MVVSGPSLAQNRWWLGNVHHSQPIFHYHVNATVPVAFPLSCHDLAWHMACVDCHWHCKHCVQEISSTTWSPLIFSKPMSTLLQSLQSYALVLQGPLIGSFVSILWVLYISSTTTSNQGWDESDSMESFVCRFSSTFRPTKMTTYCWNIWYNFYSDLNTCDEREF